MEKVTDAWELSTAQWMTLSQVRDKQVHWSDGKMRWMAESGTGFGYRDVTDHVQVLVKHALVLPGKKLRQGMVPELTAAGVELLAAI